MTRRRKLALGAVFAVVVAMGVVWLAFWREELPPGPESVVKRAVRASQAGDTKGLLECFHPNDVGHVRKVLDEIQSIRDELRLVAEEVEKKCGPSAGAKVRALGGGKDALVPLQEFADQKLEVTYDTDDAAWVVAGGQRVRVERHNDKWTIRLLTVDVSDAWWSRVGLASRYRDTVTNVARMAVQVRARALRLALAWLKQELADGSVGNDNFEAVFGQLLFRAGFVAD